MTQVRELRSTPRPTVSWVPVTDAQGRTRMEMRWHLGEDGTTRSAARTAA